MNMLKPFIYAGLSPDTSKKILTQVIMPKALYGASLWDYKTTISLHTYIKLLLGAHYNPPTESLHLLANIPPVNLVYTKERLQLIRGLVKTDNVSMLSDTPRSAITLKFMSDIKKLVHRTTKLTDLRPVDLTRHKITNCIQKEWTRQWNAQLANGMCPYGILPVLEPEHLFHQPLPLNNRRKDVGALCDLLTGHSRLLSFQYRINLTYTPVCTCLIEEETAYHYMYLCADYDTARAHTNPSTDNWESVISFLNLTRRLMF